ASRLHLYIGSVLPPYYRNRQGEHLSEVVGIFKSDVSFWQANLVLTTFESATAIFDQPGLATDLLVYCRPGYEPAVRASILRLRTDERQGDRETRRQGDDDDPRPTTQGHLVSLSPCLLQA